MISICIAYFNRKKQLYKALESISETAVDDHEIIIVDDGSSEEHRLEFNVLKALSKGKVILLEIKPEDKTWFNPCIAYNIAFSRASGDKILIQNPESYHIGDLLTYLNNHLNNSNYITFHTLALNEEASAGVYPQTNIQNTINYVAPIIRSTGPIRPGENPYIGYTIWYNHRIYRPSHYHFAAGITRENLFKIGGFDERYKEDHSWDDNEILLRITRLGLRKIIVEDPMVLHLYHPIFFGKSPHNGSKNNNFYHKVSLRENIIKVQDLNYNNYSQFIKESS